MKLFDKPILVLASLLFWSGECKAQELIVEHLANYHTVDSCFNKGVSAAFCGISNGQLVLAGGCNFPHIPAAQGGEKKYYDYIWATPLNKGVDTEWELVGSLPCPSAYGITLPYENGLLCIGGQTTHGKALKDVYLLQINQGEMTKKAFPSLPFCIDNASGAISKGKVFIAGGNADGKPSSLLLTLDLNEKTPAWKFESLIPGAPRIQPICTIVGTDLYIFGGYNPSTNGGSASMPGNALTYNLLTGIWKEIQAPRNPSGEIIALAGGAGVTTPDANVIYCIGGVNQKIFPRALNGELSGPSYMNQPVEWYKFNRFILAYHTEQQKWEILGDREEGARAGACLVNDGTWSYIVNGEVKPGIRTSLISRFRQKK